MRKLVLILVLAASFGTVQLPPAAAQDTTLSCPPWTDNPIVGGQTPIRAQHINELRTCLDLVLGALTATPPPPPPPPPGADSCSENLGTVPFGTVVREGELTAQCDSANLPDRYAKYYSFTLAQQAWVTIDLKSNSVDTLLALMEGSGTGGAVLSRDGGGGDDRGDSRIANQGLSPGTYTIEASTFATRRTGDFRLELDVSEPPVPVGGQGGVGVLNTVPDVTYRGNPANKRIGVISIETGIQVGYSVAIEIGARDHACEDGDRVEIQIFGGAQWVTPFSGEIFNHWQTRTVNLTAGYHYTVIAIALNGTGFKGACGYRDANTGEMRVSFGGRQRVSEWQAPGGSASVGVINIIP